ncbi:hypothetical protein OS493_036234 [Desmophyllum pertusum]|uniref:CUB domain-containing protein n=1 Tax=Desmophyllum pertusum TaxID=174260 RepID=A0A9W9ZWA7_9CNID|nr:hypothetical protein OS493_036234 [Desmophyllum pertusum]
MDCDYLVPIPQNMTMNISFIDFDLEAHSSCGRDYLKITNEKDQFFRCVLWSADWADGSCNWKVRIAKILLRQKYPKERICHAFYCCSRSSDLITTLVTQDSLLNTEQLQFILPNKSCRLHKFIYCFSLPPILQVTTVPPTLQVTTVFATTTVPATLQITTVPATLQVTTEITQRIKDEPRQRTDEPTREKEIFSKVITYIISGVASILFLVLCFIIGYWCYKRLHQKGVHRSARSVREIIPFDKWELLPEEIEHEEELGRGAFGVVYKATLKRRVGIEVFDTKRDWNQRRHARWLLSKCCKGECDQDENQSSADNDSMLAGTSFQVDKEIAMSSGRLSEGECDLQDENQSPADTDSMLAGTSFQVDEEIAMFSGHLSEVRNNRKSTLKYIA